MTNCKSMCKACVGHVRGMGACAEHVGPAEVRAHVSRVCCCVLRSQLGMDHGVPNPVKSTVSQLTMPITHRK